MATNRMGIATMLPMASSIQRNIHSFYARWIRPHFSPIQQQRIKLLWNIWGYHPILSIPALSRLERICLLLRLIRVDLGVQHAHWPGEIARVIKAIGERKARPEEVVVETGCWQGGSTAKFSIICRLLGYQLLIFDSFEGVEYQPGNAFSGRYVADEGLVKRHVSEYGDIEVCKFVPGWFIDTLARNPIQNPIRVVYIDCDLAKGTREVLQGVLPSLVKDGVLCSQDYHISKVSALLDDETTWEGLDQAMPTVVDRYRNLAVFRYKVE
jgi:O-methyltransferase